MASPPRRSYSTRNPLTSSSYYGVQFLARISGKLTAEAQRTWRDEIPKKSLCDLSASAVNILLVSSCGKRKLASSPEMDRNRTGDYAQNANDGLERNLLNVAQKQFRADQRPHRIGCRDRRHDNDATQT
jgi:hypothetical protein